MFIMYSVLKNNSLLSNKLFDKYGRVFCYLRLSITDICNFKCGYCLPFGYKKLDHNNFNSFLTINEIRNLISAFSDMGLEKVRLTGGEPTLRKDFFKIGKLVKSFSNIKTLAFTTNGFKLKNIVKKCFDFGFTNITVSIDSLLSFYFFSITGRNLLPDIVTGLEESLLYKFVTKINVVLLCSFSIEDFDEYLDLILDRNISVRFIELVGTKSSINFFIHNYIVSFFLRCFLEKNGWQKMKVEKNSGPAVVYYHKDYKGTIGFIASYSVNFCLFCNRLRVSSIGDVYLCLFGGTEKIFSIRNYLQRSEEKYDVMNILRNVIKYKDLSHFLLQGNIGKVNQLSEIGG